MAIRVAINGFGRIGRLVYRIASQRSDIEIVAVNDLVLADNLAYLLRYDTMHGRFGENVHAEGEEIVHGAHRTKCTAIKDPSLLPWKAMGVDYVIESTGFFTTAEDAKKHLDAGCRRVLISAPTKSEKEVPTLVYKVNHSAYNPEKDRIISNASCTTNCLAPVIKVILDSCGLEEGLMTTVHSVTATQPTQDGPSKKDWRGGRNGYMNIIPSSTGAAKAVALCLPAVKGKLTGMAFRVPTANVSCVDLTFRSERPTSLEEITKYMHAAADGPMQGVLGVTDDEVVSSDFIGDSRSSIFDVKASVQLNDRFFKLVSWYDNECGYANRCVDMVAMMASKDGVK